MRQLTVWHFGEVLQFIGETAESASEHNANARRGRTASANGAYGLIKKRRKGKSGGVHLGANVLAVKNKTI